MMARARDVRGGGETHAVRLCDDASAPIRRGAAFDETTTKQFGFGIARPISGERVVVDVEADARGCEMRDRTGRGWRSEAVATSNAHRAKSARVARRGRGERWRSAAPSSELVTTVVSILALVCVNAVLGMYRRRWGKKGAEEDVGAEAPAMDRREWGTLLGEDKVKLIEKSVAHQEERVEGLVSTAEWTIRARAEAVDYAAPGKIPAIWFTICSRRCPDPLPRKSSIASGARTARTETNRGFQKFSTASARRSRWIIRGDLTILSLQRT